MVYLDSSYDTINLRHTAKFKTRISNNLFWVPVNRLGNSRFTNQELYQLTNEKSADEVKLLGLNAYEAIQLFQCVRPFNETNDIVYFQNGGKTWQLHKSGRYAVETGEGCCSSAAAWFNYVIQNRYPDRGYIKYVRPDASGHIMNYIYMDHHYYIIDMTTQIHTNAHLVPVENGDIQCYCASTLYTGICYEAESLLDFARYHCKIQQTAGFKFSYFSMEPYDATPPTCTTIRNQTVYISTTGYYKSILLNNVGVTNEDDFELPPYLITYSNHYK